MVLKIFSLKAMKFIYKNIYILEDYEDCITCFIVALL